MSRLVDDWEYRSEENWELHDPVSFMHNGERLYGTIARIYFGSNESFHVEVDGRRYDVNLYNDDMKRNT